MALVVVFLVVQTLKKIFPEGNPLGAEETRSFSFIRFSAELCA